MPKELRPTEDLDSCEVCARTILKGERAESYLAPGGQRRLVCELCVPRAEASGWIRESAHADLPASHAPEPRRGLLERMRRRSADRGGARAGVARREAAENGAGVGEPETAGPVPHASEEPDPADGGYDTGDDWGLDEAPFVEDEETVEPAAPASSEDEPAADDRSALRRLASPRRRPRHVRAVPTNAQVKVERALEVFNASQHRRTVAGLSRTLGPPWVSAAPEPESPSNVTIVVAWELSWYRFIVDLGDAQDPVSLAEKGHELGELDAAARDWNGAVTPEGGLVAAVGTER